MIRLKLGKEKERGKIRREGGNLRCCCFAGKSMQPNMRSVCMYVGAAVNKQQD